MSVEASPVPALSAPARVGWFLLILAIYVVLGPPLAALATVAVQESYGILSGVGFDRELASRYFLDSLLREIYEYGALPAAAVGLMVGLRQSGRGATPLYAWLWALAVGVVLMIVVFADDTARTDRPLFAIVGRNLLGFAIGMMLCWWLSAALMRRLSRMA